MSPRVDLLSLAAELRADIGAAEQKAEALGSWVGRVAEGNEVYVPAGLLHHWYTAIEAAASRALRGVDGTLPAGPDSHARILDLATVEVPRVRPAVLPTSRRERLREMLDFRHLYRHGYGLALEPERVRALVVRAVEAWPDVRKTLEACVAFLEKSADLL